MILQTRVKRAGLTQADIAKELRMAQHKLVKWGTKDPWFQLGILATAARLLEQQGQGIQTDLEDFTCSKTSSDT
ncbi:hypothetical protein EB061_03650, partial [bacterium]|nr:hypothetical protein [bacterium]